MAYTKRSPSTTLARDYRRCVRNLRRPAAHRAVGLAMGIVGGLLLVPLWSTAKPIHEVHPLASPLPDADVVKNVEHTVTFPRKSLQDTVWIAEWTFDNEGVCTEAGWEKSSRMRIPNDGQVFWEIDAGFGGEGQISGNAAQLGYNDDPCCDVPYGYKNDWYQAIRFEYQGAGSISFDYLLDSELGWDFMQVEMDSACSSFGLVDYDTDPTANAATFRRILASDSGFNLNGSVVSKPLADFGTVSCLYISFFSGIQRSPCDGEHSTQIGEALVVDNIVIVDEGGNRTRIEDFEDGVLSIGTFENIHDTVQFGNWARTFAHITDNDVCTENTTCAWLFTDYTTPTIANDPSMAFGPGAFVVRNWLDNVIVSPWISLSSTPTASETVLQCQYYGGNLLFNSAIIHGWEVRDKSGECVGAWRNIGIWGDLSEFRWQDWTVDLSGGIDFTATDFQIRYVVLDLQLLGWPAPSDFRPGPGPYLDRVRIGRQVANGPLIGGTSAGTPHNQAQDAFPTEVNPAITPGTGEHFRPTTNRFGTAAFSPAADWWQNETPNLVTGDSVWVRVKDLRGAGGITSVDWCGAIVSGPHAGKAPPPWTVSANGFFLVSPDSARSTSGVPIEGGFFVDLDDFYFRGGDVLHYFWLATDALGGMTSLPRGLTGIPTSAEAAQEATRGLFEVSFLPTITWDPDYLARISVDPHGKLEPTIEELANSSQTNCILYVQGVNFDRRSGDINRTSFMYTLDRLGYRGHYDVYDHQGITGKTCNNNLGGRATIQQAQGYNLIVYDTGNTSVGSLMPDGSNLSLGKIDQETWFRNWLAQAPVSEAGFATLWLIGSDALETDPTYPLYAAYMAVTLNRENQGLSANPDVEGEASFTFSQNNLNICNADFSSDAYSLAGGCPEIRDYDGIGSLGSGEETHRYYDPVTGNAGDAAIVMNTNPAEAWNTVFQSHPWFDIRDPFGEAPVSPEPQAVLLSKVLGCALPIECQQSLDPTDVPRQGAAIDGPPIRTALYQNVPNPFNPATTISFDLARDAHVQLKIYDVTGRLVRKLVDGRLERNRHEVVWDGMNDAGVYVSSGIYFYRLGTADFTDTRKLVVVR